MTDAAGGGPNWAEIAAVVVTAVTAVGGLGSRVIYSILGEKINAKSEELHKKIDAQRIELHSRIDAQRAELVDAIAEESSAMRVVIKDEGRAYGESLAAIREHISQLGFFIRDNFVRRDEFQTAMQQLGASSRGIDEKLERIRAALDAKIDKIGPSGPR